MSDRQYKVYLSEIYFDSLYGTDYYYDKSNFFAYGAKQFFTIYQISRCGDFNFAIVEESSGNKFEFIDSAEFRRWVKQNYEHFEKHLDNFSWSEHPESKLR